LEPVHIGHSCFELFGEVWQSLEHIYHTTKLTTPSIMLPACAPPLRTHVRALAKFHAFLRTDTRPKVVCCTQNPDPRGLEGATSRHVTQPRKSRARSARALLLRATPPGAWGAHDQPVPAVTDM
jgi:hypothetical protein